MCLAQGAVALWGVNGAGKTTVIKCLLGLLRFDGQITVDGCDVRRQGAPPASASAMCRKNWPSTRR